MASFTIDTDAVRQKANVVENFADEYDAIRLRLLNTATSMGAAYESADNKVYVARITECCNQLQQMSEKLRNAAQILKSQSDSYDATEENNTQQASKLP